MNTDPQAWITEFEAWARFTSVPMEQAETVFLSCLDETTREKLRVEFSVFPLERSTWDCVRDRFINKFRKTEPQHYYVQRMNEAVQETDESVADFADRIATLAFKAYGADAQMQERRMRDIFLVGLRQDIYTCVKGARPTTFREAI